MLFSIITAVYNNKAEISGAINSVAGQKNVMIEHIVMDGCSNDGTAELVVSIKSDIVNFESSKDRGIYDALNKGIAKAKGDIIGILHSDDLFSDEHVLKDVLEKFAAGYDGVYADLDYVSKDNTSNVIRRWKTGNFDEFQLKLGWMPPHPTLFLRRSVYEKIGNFNLNYRIAADYDFMLRVLADKDYKIAYLPRTIVKMRIGGESNRSLKNILKKSKEDLAIASIYFNAPILTVISKNVRKVNQLFSRVK